MCQYFCIEKRKKELVLSGIDECQRWLPFNHCTVTNGTLDNFNEHMFLFFKRIPLWNSSPNSGGSGGVRWHQTGEPPAGYEYRVEYGRGDNSEEYVEVDGSDLKISALLIWTYNFFVHRVFTDAVILDEELVLLVKDAEIRYEPEWAAIIKVFSIWEQDEAVVTFKLSHKQG